MVDGEKARDEKNETKPVNESNQEMGFREFDMWKSDRGGDDVLHVSQVPGLHIVA